MAKTMTFEEILNQNPNLYNGTDMADDSATKSIIYDWFRYRYVTDNNRFPTYFKRVINRDYSRYLQLLRIEAGKKGNSGSTTEYDWLVNEYFEELGKGIGSATEQKTTTGTTSKGTNYTETETHSGQDSSYGGNTYADSSNYSSNGGSSHSSNASSNEHSNVGTTTESRAGALARNTPMSAEYTHDNMVENNYNHGFAQASNNRAISGYMDTRNAGYPSNASSIAAIGDNFPTLNIKNPSSTTDSLTVGGSVTETDTHGSTNASDNESHNEGGSTSSNGNATNNNTLTHGHVITRVHNGNVESGSQSTGSNASISKNDRKEIQHTGRHGDVAEMLQEVIKYINKSSAIDWYRRQLETCFMQCFD